MNSLEIFDHFHQLFADGVCNFGKLGIFYGGHGSHRINRRDFGSLDCLLHDHVAG